MSNAKELRVGVLRQYAATASQRMQQACAVLYDLVSDDVFTPAVNDWLLVHLPDIISILALREQEELTPNDVEDVVVIVERYFR